MTSASAAAVLSIGDELLIGQVVNTNQAEIAQMLNQAGLRVTMMLTVPDALDDILKAFDRAAAGSSVVTVTGGLGPTHDDVTRTAVCRYLGTDLVRDDETLRRVRAMFGRRGLPVTPANEDQAMVPRGVSIIPNDHGTAPGYRFTRNDTDFFVMPGVPYEMRGMMESTVMPALRATPRASVVVHRTIKTTGIAESHLSERLGDTAALLGGAEGLSLAYLPNPLGVRLRITAVRGSVDEALRLIGEAEARILEKASKYVYGFDDDELESVVGKLLQDGGRTIAVAESCTGGLILDRLTDVPGSSAYVERGFVCYSDASKTAELGVPENVIARHGAVSADVARSMAEGARETAGTDIGLSTTGIAGPAGGSAEKPVGLVFIGYADASGSLAVRFTFLPSRRRIKERTAQAALELLRRKLLRME